MAKTFDRNRPREEIKAACEERGWEWDQSRFDAGSDYITFGFQSGRKKVRVIYSSFNGKFIVKQGRDFITEASTGMDGTKWYDDLLDFIYLPSAAAA